MRTIVLAAVLALPTSTLAQQSIEPKRSTIGSSAQGRPLDLITLSAPGDVGRGPDDRPALLIVSGINGQFTTGPAVAEGVAAALASGHADILARFTVYIIPSLNPDLAAWHAASASRMNLSRSTTPVDDDHDGRIDEDGPIDLNGDGVISMMRLRNPPPGSDHRATLMADPKDPRILREPDALKGEHAEYALIVEGRDQDGDGLIAEDGPGGVVFDRNFPYRWPELEDGAGLFQLCEPETRAIVDWMLTRNNIVAVLVYGEHDTLANVPVSGEMDITGQVPRGIEEPDKKYYEELSKTFKELTRINECPRPDSAGAFHGWAYANFGVFSFSTPTWVRPDQMKAEEAKPKAEPAPEGGGGDDAAPPAEPDSDQAFQAEFRARMAEYINADENRRAQMMREFMQAPPEVQARIRQAALASGAPASLFSNASPASNGAAPAAVQPEAGPPPGGRRRGGGGPGGGGRFGGAPPGGGGGGRASEGATGDDAKWLEFIDKQLDGNGFTPWTPFDHPDLGPVEIGGFDPGVKLNAPESSIPDITAAQTRFAAALLDKLPRLRVDPPAVQDLGGGVWQVTVRVANDGFLPTRSAMGIKTRRLHPLLVSLDLPDDRFLAGAKRQSIQSLAGSGGSFEAQWMVTGQAGSSVTVEVRSAEYGTQSIAINLGATP